MENVEIESSFPPSIRNRPSISPSLFTMVDFPLNVRPFTPRISEKKGMIVFWKDVILEQWSFQMQNSNFS